MAEMHHASLATSRLRDSYSELPENVLDAIDDFLAHLAALGSDLTAKTRIEYLIERGDLDSALKFSSRIANVMVALNAKNDSSADPPVPAGSTPSRPANGPREFGLKPPLTAHIITICIMKGTLRPLLQHDLTYAATGFRFEELKVAVAANAEQFKLSREQHLTWAGRCRTLGIVALPWDAFQTYISTEFFRPGRMDAVQLARSIMQELEDAEPCIVVGNPRSDAERDAVYLSEAHWASLAQRLIQSGDADVATALCEALERVVGHTPPRVQAALIEGFASAQQFNRVRDCWTMYSNRPGASDAVVYRAYIDALFREGRSEDALDALERFAAEAAPDATSVFNVVLDWLVREARVDEAHAMLKRMEDTGPAPDTASYNAFLRGNTDYDAITGVLRAMDERDVPADAETAALLLAACHPTPDRAPAFALDRLKKAQPVDLAACEDILRRLTQLDDDAAFDAARALLARMRTYGGALAPTLDTYVTVLSGVERRTWHDSAAAGRHRLALMGGINWRRFPAEEWEAGIKHLIRACCVNPGPDAMQHAMGYYREYIRARGNTRPPDWIIWGTLMSELLRRKQYAEVAWMMDDIDKTDLSPSLQALLAEAERSVKGRKQSRATDEEKRDV
ncbi:hypothetical protein PsYK624_085880 [Phanerochaete sordida]|uniref:Pentacotripeptide-repeat region of PRORP domain-containing protein n=1 Tax=Phanerochaete sordida TaxID=48140 RepID=A0A9P3GEU2_9APHY|nr:hypothetical protein PsYK624_085880 [Phanerochaete sordida]